MSTFEGGLCLMKLFLFTTRNLNVRPLSGHEVQLKIYGFVSLAL